MADYPESEERVRAAVLVWREKIEENSPPVSRERAVVLETLRVCADQIDEALDG